MDNLVPIPTDKLQIMPTQEIVDYFLENQNSEGTSQTYGASLRSFFAWTNGKSYKIVTPLDALEYDRYLKANFEKSTVQRQISTIKTFFKFCKDCGLIDKNPFAVVKQKAAANQAAQKFIVPRELERLLHALRKKSAQRYIFGLLLAASGTRIAEIANLSVCDLIEGPDGSGFINVTRKGGKTQLLAVRKDVWDQLITFIDRPLSQFDKSPLFLNPSKKRISEVSLRTWIKEAAKDARISKPVTPHWLRHSFATNALDNGADIRDLKEYLGHSSITTTQIYAHSTNKKVGEFIKLPDLTNQSDQ